jgi:penicillin-insensitive murein endopeptidase
MRPSRNRRYGHPDLISYIKGYGRRIKKKGLGTLLIGDLGQPMGGPSPFGHASHQSGLDVDIWFWRPDVANQRKLTMKERETMGAPSFVHKPTKTLTSYWSPKTARMLRLAAQDPKVARIFVNPVIKRELCESKKNKDWLRKIRPWYGHRDHMHVRLECPESSPDCVPQKQLPKGSGCDGLDWWFRDVKKSERKKGKKKYSKKVRKPAILPDICYEMKSK